MSDSKRLSGNLKESVVIDPGYTSGESEDDDSEDEDPPIERVESKKFMRRLSVGEQPSPKGIFSGVPTPSNALQRRWGEKIWEIWIVG